MVNLFEEFHFDKYYPSVHRAGFAQAVAAKDIHRCQNQ